MQNIKVIKTGINVSKILKQLEQYPEDWGAQKNIDGALSMLDRGFPEVSAGVLQLIMGGVRTVDEYVGDTEICIPTLACEHHTEVLRFVKRHFKKVSRCGFLSLPVGGSVGRHIDIGNYYQTRNRYHLAIQGSYRYFVGDESLVINAGDLIWFNNKLEHGTENLSNCVRITFVFDVPI
jgi:hypothetical protein